MEYVITSLLLLLGLGLIVKGGDLFVDAASWMAEVSGIPKLIVGATVVSIATTLPELLVSTLAAARGSVDMATGNAVGSVIANMGLIMAISFLFLPAKIARRDYFLKACLMIGAPAVLLIFSRKGAVSLVISVLLLMIFAAAMGENVASALRAMKDENDGARRRRPTKKETLIMIVKFLLGVAGIVFGADLLVDNGSKLALALGVSEQIVGVTILAVGTSLPELVTTVTALIKKQSALSVGNIIGANILDMTLILPACAVISGGSLPVSRQTLMLDLPVCLALSAVALIPALITRRFCRWQGVVLLLLYAAYLTVAIVVF